MVNLETLLIAIFKFSSFWYGTMCNFCNFMSYDCCLMRTH